MKYRNLYKKGKCAVCCKELTTEDKAIIFKSKTTNKSYVTICDDCIDELKRLTENES